MRHAFKKLPGGYSFVELSSVNKDAILQSKAGGVSDTAPCSLSSSVASLVDLMFDEDIIMHSLKEVSFQWKNPDFLLKNPDFLLRNPDFLLKSVDFIIKTPGRRQPRRDATR